MAASPRFPPKHSGCRGVRRRHHRHGSGPHRWAVKRAKLARTPDRNALSGQPVVGCVAGVECVLSNWAMYDASPAGTKRNGPISPQEAWHV